MIPTALPRFFRQPVRPPSSGSRHCPSRILVPLLAATLSACRIVVTVPEGGKVVTEDGFECLAGQTCYVEVSDDSFDSTFTAMADDGYSFTRWKKKAPGFCGNKPGTCYLSTGALGGIQAALDILASDQEFFLEPEFVHYDLAYWRKLLAEIDEESFATAGFLYAKTPDVGNCDPGELKPGAIDRAVKAFNRVRALHYLPGVDADSTYDMEVQESSLVQRANNYLSHFPDPGDTCYTAGAEAAASTSNLSGGGGGPADPASDILGWTNDNNNLAAVMEAGHRRWMLYPPLAVTSYGQVDGYGSLKVFGFDSPSSNPVPGDLEFVALPYQHYPHVLVSQGDKPTPWSISIVPPGGTRDGFDYFSQATVEVAVKGSGKQLAVQNLHRDNNLAGLDNFLSWMVGGWQYDVEYLVTIGNVRMPGGGMTDISYPVTVDRYNLFDVSHPRESTDSSDGTTLTGQFNSPLDRDSFVVRLDGRMSVTGRSEFSNWAFFVLVYDQDKKLVKSSSAAFNIDVKKGKYTIVLSLCDEDGLCFQTTRNYTVNFNPT